jgi:hypothetical protein
MIFGMGSGSVFENVSAQKRYPFDHATDDRFCAETLVLESLRSSLDDRWL